MQYLSLRAVMLPNWLKEIADQATPQEVAQLNKVLDMNTASCECGTVCPSAEGLKVHQGICPVLLKKRISELERQVNALFGIVESHED